MDNEPAAILLREKLETADGFVVVSPEWNGMAAPALKNMFVYVRKTMAHKPATLNCCLMEASSIPCCFIATTY